MVKKIITFVKRMFPRFKNTLAQSERIIIVVAQIKKVVDNPALDLITTFTENQVDNLVVKQLRTVLDAILDLGEKLKENATKKDAYIAYMHAIRAEKEPIRNAIYLKLASTLLQAENKDMSESEADFITQTAFINQKN